MTRGWVAAVAIVSVFAPVACGPEGGVVPRGSQDAGTTLPPKDKTPPADAVDAGVQTPPPDDGGALPPDAGEPDAGVVIGPGPWPTDAVLNYTARYGTGVVQSVGVDDAQNIWLLRGDAIGVIRPGTTSPVWAKGIGQAAPGFGDDKLALSSTVICGGAANQAYVGYRAPRRSGESKLSDVNDPDYAKGDLDVVQLNPEGTISLTEHLWRSSGTSQPWPPVNLGIRNSNDWHYNEDHTVLTCAKVMRGRDRGEVYIGTNHGVTRIRGLVYNSHRHPIWDSEDGTPNIGYSWGLGIAQNGDVLIANNWMVAILPPPEALGDWELFGPAPWAVNTWNQVLNSREEQDYWRGFQQTSDGRYFLGSAQFGLWRMERTQWAGSANWFKVGGLPTEAINALAATDDGSLFIGTENSGLWRMDAEGNLSRFSAVSGSRVRQLVYDPTVSPAALYVVSGDALYVVRGH